MNSSGMGYYPGCALVGSSKEYEQSIKRILQEIGFGLNEINDWNCCGASAAHSTNHQLSLALPYRNLALASKQNMDEIFAPCPFCARTLLYTDQQVNQNKHIGEEMTRITGSGYEKPVKILNIVQLVQKLLDKFTPKIKQDALKDYKIASYYGCLLVRPPKLMNFDKPDNPQSIDTIVKSLGATTVDWEFKTECCGGGFTVSNPEAVVKLSHKILQDAQDNGANLIVVVCQMCQVNLDMRQRAVEKKFDVSFNLPVIYLSQLVGLAMGIPPEELGIQHHFVKSNNLIGAELTAKK